MANAFAKPGRNPRPLGRGGSQTINRGNTGRPVGCQKTIVHLVSTLAVGIDQNRVWAISDGNAGAFHAVFSCQLAKLSCLDWASIHATQWQGKTHQKSSEFLIADFFDWSGFHAVGCHNETIARQVQDLVGQTIYRPAVSVEPDWYY